MAEGSSRNSKKRSFADDEESEKPSTEKRVRFPKGKKVKQGDSVLDSTGEVVPSKDPRVASRLRAIRRNTNTDLNTDIEELLDSKNVDLLTIIRKAEVQYKDNETFAGEDVQLEPFNLDEERKVGYFDDNGNYVEYVQNEIKDAWLDSLDSQQNYAKKSSVLISTDGEPHDLSTKELAEINRRIAGVLESGETVLRALKRLKGSTDKKQKMSVETKRLFDQLTEDAMKLMDNGDYNVYDEKQEQFEREAEGYEKLDRARKGNPDDMFDMFGDDNDSAVGDPAKDGVGSASVQLSQAGGMQYDYAYDESSGYYYSSTSGYYYDPSSGLYGCAASGKWYSYNEESASYDEVQQDTNATAVS